MNNNELYEIAKDALNDAELRSSDIPPIDLYVDQILNLISDRVEHGSERYRDRQLTKTMINNYSKDGLIAPVKGKKYNKEQILQMLSVYTLKGSLSIGEIKRVLGGAYAIEGFNGDSLASLYDKYLDTKDNNRQYVLAVISDMLDGNDIDVGKDEDYIGLIFALSALSAHIRGIAQAMIDARFPEPIDSGDDDEKKKEKEEKKADKKQKKEEKRESKAKAKEQ